MSRARGRGGPVVTMRRGDAAVLLGGIAGLTLWLSLTDGMLRYVRPAMRPWLVASGVLVGVLAVAVGVTARRADRARPGDDGPGDRRGPGDGHRHRGPWLVGWLVGLPLVVAVAVDPGALGAYAIRQSPGGVPTIDFDLEHHLRTRTFGGQTPRLQLHQFLVAANGDGADQRLLAETDVRLTGFVVAPADDTGAAPGADASGRFLLGRLMIGCCAGDAIGLSVDVRGYDGPLLDDETWIEVTGRYDPAATDAARRSAPDSDEARTAPVLALSSLREVDPPTEPYESPR